MDTKVDTVLETKALIPKTYVARVYVTTSDTMRSSSTFQSTDKPYLWVCDTSLRAMTTVRVGQGYIVDILEVGLVLNKIESFYIELQEELDCIKSFSPTTYHVSASLPGRLVILDVRNADCLLEEEGAYLCRVFLFRRKPFCSMPEVEGHPYLEIHLRLLYPVEGIFIS